MQTKLHSRPDLLLLLSLLLVILLSPAMDHSDWRRPVFAALIFIPVVLCHRHVVANKSVGVAVGSVDVGRSHLPGGEATSFAARH